MGNTKDTFTNILLKRHFPNDMKLLYKNEYVCFSVLIQELKLVIIEIIFYFRLRQKPTSIQEAIATKLYKTNSQSIFNLD